MTGVKVLDECQSMSNQSSSLSAEHKRNKGAAAVLMLYGGAVLFLCAVAVIAAYDLELRLGDLTRDPVAVLEGHQLTGLVSTVGILLWTIAASMCLFSHVLLLSMRYFRKIILTRKSILFWAALVFFGASLGVDFLVDSSFVSLSFNSGVFVEDSFKFLGIVSWTSFLVNMSFQELKATLNQYPEPESR